MESAAPPRAPRSNKRNDAVVGLTAASESGGKEVRNRFPVKCDPENVMLAYRHMLLRLNSMLGARMEDGRDPDPFDHYANATQRILSSRGLSLDSEQQFELNTSRVEPDARSHPGNIAYSI
ncbi:MAG: acyl-ACP desaturase [Paludisphaera borealis]|uniref:acyl-ACP desaturase n=1 Tax=Paludisphaera borealis TaxID=1387353 RepID=UPI00283C4787|nr:acyl-ACP desaturase [Paludisphaera borealis]MDR3621373.1 acyl-ACP desaturase [Paludisphaera borealis]